MTFRISITNRAERDLREIQDWIQARSTSGAFKWLAAFTIAIERLASDPFACILAPESDHLRVELRQQIFKTRRGNPYRVVFRIVDDVIEIVAVRGFGRELIQPTDLDLFD